MRSKSALLLAVALGCGTVAAFAATQVIKDQGTAPTVAMIEILVATKDINGTVKIGPDRFHLEKWPQDRLPPGAIRDMKTVEGKYTNQRLFQGEPLLERKVNLTNESIAQRIPEGFKVFDLPVDSTNGGVGYIQPGHRIDIHGFFEKGGKLRESKSLMVMENVEVLMVDGVAVREQDEGHNKKAATMQLLIRSSQFEALNTARYLGKLNVSLRPTQDVGGAEVETDNGDAFLQWVRTAVNEEESIPKQEVASETKKQATRAVPKNKMLVISPNGTESYVWNDEGEIPRREETSTEQNASTADHSVEGSPEPSNSQSLTSGMVWDGKQWTYNPSGFKPVYPTADDDKTKKKGSNGKDDNPALPESPAS
jgi:pilus assembly protein CpaB